MFVVVVTANIGRPMRSRVVKQRHKDPFDRMLAAQSVVDGLRLVSRDPIFADFGLEPLW
jgi:PIN domain nuclease of toxin-antitoxin system